MKLYDELAEWWPLFSAPVDYAEDYVRENFAAITEHGGHYGADGRSLRFLEWTVDPDPGDTTYQTDYAIVMRDRRFDTRVVEDCHIEGLFPRAEWIRLLRAGGFDPSITRDEWGRDLFVAKRPA